MICDFKNEQAFILSFSKRRNSRFPFMLQSIQFRMNKRCFFHIVNRQKSVIMWGVHFLKLSLKQHGSLQKM